MKKHYARKSVYSLLLLVTYQLVCAQVTSDSTIVTKPSYFLTLGVGAGTPGLASTIQLNIELKKRFIITAGATFLEYDVDYTSTPFVEFGKIRKTKNSFSRWGLGPSYSKLIICSQGFWGPNCDIITEEKKSLGVHMTFQKMFAGKYLGFGASVFADLNLVKPYAGILLNLAIGQIK